MNRRKSRKDTLREDAPSYRVNENGAYQPLRFLDLFCGIGGFREKRLFEFLEFPAEGPKLVSLFFLENFGKL